MFKEEEDFIDDSDDSDVSFSGTSTGSEDDTNAKK